jgi:ferredoxin
VFPEQETVTQSIYSVDGERTVFDAAYIAPEAVGALTITEPTTDQYAVIHRAAWFCPTASAPRLEFKLRRTYNSLKATQGFIWNLL